MPDRITIFQGPHERLAQDPGEVADPAARMEREILDVVSQAEVSGAVDESEK